MPLSPSKYICYNGAFVKADRPVLFHSNRGLKFGDAVFESIRSIANEPLFFSDHFHRLKQGIKLFQFEPDTHFRELEIKELCNKLLTKNRIFKGGRLRITFFRDSEGNYIPSSNKTSFIIECQPVENEFFTLNKQGKHLGIYATDKVSINRFSNIKHANSMVYVMAGLYAKKHGFDECLLLNDNGHLCEATSSNFFIYKNNTLFTPSVKEGCVAGIMRYQVIKIAQQNNIDIYNSLPLTEKDLPEADEIFITNAVRGIQWIVSYKSKRYYHTMASKLVHLLNEEVRKKIS